MANRIRPEKFKRLTDLSITDEDKQGLTNFSFSKVEDACKDLIIKGQVICDQELLKRQTG